MNLKKFLLIPITIGGLFILHSCIKETEGDGPFLCGKDYSMYGGFNPYPTQPVSFYLSKNIECSSITLKNVYNMTMKNDDYAPSTSINVYWDEVPPCGAEGTMKVDLVKDCEYVATFECENGASFKRQFRTGCDDTCMMVSIN